MSEAKRPAAHMHITTTLLDSFIILLNNRCIFFSLFLFLTLPLSALHFCFTLFSMPLKDHVFHLEALASVVHTRFEARQIWQESREDAVSFLRLKSRFFIPSFILSCVSSIAAITSTSLSYHAKTPSIGTLLPAIKSSWMHVTATSIIIYALLFLYSAISTFLSAIIHSTPALRFLFMGLSLGIEVYMMAVTGLGLVVSALEEKYGMEAIKKGWSLMKEGRGCGVVLSGGFVVMSSVMGHAMEKTVRGREVAMDEEWWWRRVVEGAGVVCLYGAQVLFCYVVTTVFYCVCKRRHGTRDEARVSDHL